MPSQSDAHHKNPALQEALTRIYNLHRKSFDFRLDSGPYRDLLIKLGNPQNRLPPTIHVAGTNGKGSTIAHMRAQLEALDYKVHVHTSPHLFEFNERLRIAGTLISDDVLLEEIEHVWTLNEGASLTFFEFTSALMFHVFAKYPADYALIEVGMGGRLDCTNVIENPVLTVITSIGYDHQLFLGEDIASIAGEKAGIIKPNVTCVLAYQPYAEAYAPIQKTADRLSAKLVLAEHSKTVPTPMIGAHQKENAKTANAALEALLPYFKWNNNAKPNWPGRFQKLNAPFDLYYDGAHNVDGLKALKEAITTELPHRPISFIIAMQSKKDPSIISQTLLSQTSLLNAQFYVTSVNVGADDKTALELTHKYEQAGIAITAHHDDMGLLIEKAHTDNPKNIIFVIGSLYAAQLIPDRYWRTIIV